MDIAADVGNLNELFLMLLWPCVPVALPVTPSLDIPMLMGFPTSVQISLDATGTSRLLVFVVHAEALQYAQG